MRHFVRCRPAVWRAGLVLAVFCGAGAAIAQQPAADASKVEITTFEGWQLSCRIPEKGAGPRVCSAVLTIVNVDPNTRQSRPVFAWVVGMRDKKPAGVFQLPTGVLIQPGVSVQAGKDTTVIPYSQCSSGGCEAIVPMDDAFTKAATSAQSIDATIVGTDGKSLKFTINTKGYGRVLQEVQKP